MRWSAALPTAECKCLNRQTGMPAHAFNTPSDTTTGPVAAMSLDRAGRVGYPDLRINRSARPPERAVFASAGASLRQFTPL
jgi:hypothetical protein